MKQKQSLYLHLLPVISIFTLVLFTLFSFAVPSVHAESQQYSSTGSILYLHSVRDTQLSSDYYQMNTSAPISSTTIPPRAYWITPTQTATFAQGTWTLSVTVQVRVVPSINIYTLAVLSSTGAWVRDIGGAVSRRYNVAGTQQDTILFSAPSQTLTHQRLELFYIVPNWCTAAPVITGAKTYISLPARQ